MTDERLAELAESLAEVRARLEVACRAAGRAASEVTLVAISKTWPAADILRLVSLGLTDFGESYDREAATKAAALDAAGAAVRWHYVGRLQRNKCRSVASYASVVQSVDRLEVAVALAAGAARAGRELGVLVQVSLDPVPAEPGSARGGCPPDEALALASRVSALQGLTVCGVMAVAPRAGGARAAFARLREVSEALRVEHPGADIVSAGMSGDLEEAIAEGATHVRVGTALFGARGADG
ncbi:MAG TPA: YggS family pyridoxal phosphate-dependent enzyme [Mycobacteriales bacterium]|nr:YggS family pyridoxal phosphate-dependent enzyme [Mycobacteriales bacterium]